MHVTHVTNTVRWNVEKMNTFNEMAAQMTELKLWIAGGRRLHSESPKYVNDVYPFLRMAERAWLAAAILHRRSSASSSSKPA